MKKSLSRLLFHLEAERLSPSLLTQRQFTASFNSDDDYVKFPTDSIFPGSSLAGVEVSLIPQTVGSGLLGDYTEFSPQIFSVLMFITLSWLMIEF